jgi:RimJ/RimL family protein N-acetyltransferase
MILWLDSAILRPLTEADAEVLARHGNDRRVWLNMRDIFPHPFLLQDGLDFIRRQAQAAVPMSFGIDVEGEAVGVIGMRQLDDVHRQTAELGYWLGVQFWGRGTATQAVRAVTKHGFDCGFERVQATVFDWNPASARVLEKAGYTLEGRLRRHVTKAGRVGDLLMYARVRG